MNIDQFVLLRFGRKVDVDGHYGGQCTDLARDFLKQVLKLPPYVIPPVTWAYQMYDNFPDGGDENFEKVKKTPTNFQERGCVVFWKPTPGIIGEPGHVALCLSADIDSQLVFEQNWNGGLCEIRRDKYRGMEEMGWLRPKNLEGESERLS